MHSQAEKVDTLVPHNDAVPAPCAHYGQGCGGCAMQDLAYAAQLKAKHRQVCMSAHPLWRFLFLFSTHRVRRLGQGQASLPGWK